MSMTTEELAAVQARIQDFIARLQEKQALMEAAVTSEDRSVYHLEVEKLQAELREIQSMIRP